MLSVLQHNNIGNAAVIVTQSSVFDLRDTHEKMVSRSTITLMAVNAGQLSYKKR
jgi:hypothetical protein